MQQRGKLFVFEGPDGVGKTELSTRFAALLNERGTEVIRLSFPGSEEGTIGKLVYQLHHTPHSLGVSKLSSSSMQLMHVAAHLDTIESKILPALRSGTSVVLDRFWWSTKVYGLAGGSDRTLLESMIDVELAAWGKTTPECVFLIRRKKPLRAEPALQWRKWCELYEQVYVEEQHQTKVSALDNDASVEAAMRCLMAVVDGGGAKPRAKKGVQLPLGLETHSPKKIIGTPSVFSAIAPARPTLAYDTYGRFAAERQEIFFKRWQRRPAPWTTDTILSEFKFTNAYRASDRVSQFLIKDVIYQGDQSEEEVFFRTILFKLFNKVDTWHLLERSLGCLTYRDFEFAAYDGVLSTAINSGKTIYSAAYIMPSGSKALGTTRKHRSHLKLLQ